MPTGACGINCDTCRLNLLGTCSSCGPGNSIAAEKKLAAQQRLLGGVCSILACARGNQIEYCMRDCSRFPCDNFQQGPYPFSQGFLNMQARRRQQGPPAVAPDGSTVKVAANYWDALQNKDVRTLANLTLFQPVSEQQLTFPFFRETVMVDLKDRCLKRSCTGSWDIKDDPLLELVTVVYLITVEEMAPVGRDIVGVNDLKEAHFFRGPHALRIDPLLKRYGGDLKGFQQAAEYLNGEPLEMADAAYRLLPFPRIPLYYLLWVGDEEFGPRMTVLFDRSIETVLAADAIWALVNRVSTELLLGPGG